MSEIVKDYSFYKDTTYGAIQPEANGKRSQNGIRFSCEYLYAMLTNNMLVGDEMDRVMEYITACEIQPGLLARYPDNYGGLQGPDDIYAALWADSQFGNGFAARFLEYGRERGALRWGKKDEHKSKVGSFAAYSALSLGGLCAIKWTYNNMTPRSFSLSSWLGRQPSLIVCAKLVAGEPISIIELEWLKFGIKSSAKSTKQDHKMLGLWQVEIAKKHMFIETESVTRNWSAKLREQFPHGLGEVLGRYFHPAHFDHPSAKWLVRKYGV